MNKDFGFKLLRYSLALVFIWFGVLKIFNSSPVSQLIAQVAPVSFPLQLPLIGLFEVALGISFFVKRLNKLSSLAMILYLLGITVFVLLRKGFAPWFPLLSYDGEFVLKNLVFIAAGFVLFTHHEEEKEKE